MKKGGIPHIRVVPKPCVNNQQVTTLYNSEGPEEVHTIAKGKGRRTMKQLERARGPTCCATGSRKFNLAKNTNKAVVFKPTDFQNHMQRYIILYILDVFVIREQTTNGNTH